MEMIRNEMESENVKKPVIGLDFGNYKSFVCYISDFDEGTKMGGIVHDLLPQGLNDGIPSVFFYSNRAGTLCGEDAMRDRAKPVENRIRYLKRHLGETMILDGKKISYDLAITEVIQHCVRRANEQLKSGYQVTTNLISLSYPATYTCAQRQRLIELAEHATLTDGTKIKVYGTIAEPAAAALDYLAGLKSTEETTILVYDLGGGTFDLALVSVYPEGKRNSEGDLYYYDIINTGGLAKVGGAEFDEIMFNLLQKKFNVPLKPVHKNELRKLAERVKVDLSSDIYAEPELLYKDEFLDAYVTREEFEAVSHELLMKTIIETKNFLNNHPNQQPQFILLTGGASQMPMVQRELQSALPEFKEKIIYFRPSRAVAYGAARFGTSEAIIDPVERTFEEMLEGISEENTDSVKKKTIIQQRVKYDIGIRFFRSKDDEKGYIYTYIKEGTPIPYATEYQRSYTAYKNQRYSKFRVYEANKQHPDTERVFDDYQEIMYVRLDHETEVPMGTKSETRLVVDGLGRLTIEARDVDKPGKPPIKQDVELKNLS